MSKYGQIDVSIKDDVFTIEIGGMDGATHNGLARVFRDAHESDAKVVVVTGKNRTFLSPDKYAFNGWQAAAAYCAAGAEDDEVSAGGVAAGGAAIPSCSRT